MGSVSGQNLVPEGGYGEVSSDAGGGGGVVEHDDLVGPDAELGLKGGHKLGKPADLGRSGHGMVEISDKTNADAGGLDGIDAGRGGGGLLGVPARADLNFAVLASIAVADHEMIAQSNAGACQSVGGAAGGCGMVDVDELPSLDFGKDGGFEDFVKERAVVGGPKAVEPLCGQGGRRQEKQQGAGEGKHGDKAGENDDFPIGTHDKAQATCGF